MEREAVSIWLAAFMYLNADGETLYGLSRLPKALIRADAVIALVEDRVRAALNEPDERVVAQSCGCCSDYVEIPVDEIVAKVMGRSPGL